MPKGNVGKSLSLHRPLSRQVDLNLLELFESVHRTRNLTASGRALGLSQPAVSRGLARLRTMYDDQLFVRHPRGVQPTPFAEGLAQPVASALAIVRATVEKPSFEPATARRNFRIASSDIGERYFLPRLSQNLAAAAPWVTVEVVPFPEVDLMTGLASGELDLAVGFLPPLGKQVHVQRLFRERFVYVMRRGHPLIRRRALSIADLRRTRHVLVNPPGTPHLAEVAKVLRGPTVQAPIALQVRSFLCVGPIVGSCDLVSVVPSNLAALVAENVDIELVDPPVKFRGFDVAIAWHQRVHRDPGLEWLRGHSLPCSRKMLKATAYRQLR